MYDFKYDNVVVRFWAHKGEILSRERRSKPVDYQIEDEYWIKTPEGLELEVVFNNPDFRYSPGDEVTVIYAGTPNGNQSISTLVHNHTISQGATLANTEWLFGQLVQPASRGMTVLIALIMTVASPWFLGAWSLPSGLIFYLLVRAEEARRKKRMISGLETHIEQLREQIYQADERLDVDAVLARNL